MWTFSLIGHGSCWLNLCGRTFLRRRRIRTHAVTSGWAWIFSCTLRTSCGSQRFGNRAVVSDFFTFLTLYDLPAAAVMAEVCSAVTGVFGVTEVVDASLSGLSPAMDRFYWPIGRWWSQTPCRRDEATHHSRRTWAPCCSARPTTGLRYPGQLRCNPAALRRCQAARPSSCGRWSCFDRTTDESCTEKKEGVTQDWGAFRWGWMITSPVQADPDTPVLRQDLNFQVLSLVVDADQVRVVRPAVLLSGRPAHLLPDEHKALAGFACSCGRRQRSANIWQGGRSCSGAATVGFLGGKVFARCAWAFGATVQTTDKWVLQEALGVFPHSSAPHLHAHLFPVEVVRLPEVPVPVVALHVTIVTTVYGGPPPAREVIKQPDPGRLSEASRGLGWVHQAVHVLDVEDGGQVCVVSPAVRLGLGPGQSRVDEVVLKEGVDEGTEDCDGGQKDVSQSLLNASVLVFTGLHVKITCEQQEDETCPHHVHAAVFTPSLQHTRKFDFTIIFKSPMMQLTHKND